jgi:predicted AlkP superfamily phosphohydrolase/phosphomutase
MHKGKTSDIPGLIAPADLAPRFEGMIITPDELPEEKIDALLDLDGLDRAGRRKLKEEFPDWFTMVEGGMARDLTHQAIFHAALKERPDWRFAAVYFRAMDNMHHASWHYNDLPGDSLAEHPERRFRNAVRRYYDHCDALLDGIADYVDSNTVVIVMSDHGWDDAATAHNYAPDGFFTMAGGPVPHSEARGRIHVYDITPTVLDLLGLPVGADMEGSAAAGMMSADFRRNNPLRTIPTYETEQRSGAAPDMQMDEETIKELKALGYIN